MFEIIILKVFFYKNINFTKKNCDYKIKSRITINVIKPDINPIRANQVIFLKNQKKSIFSIPIATTPAAEPITSILPPVPAE